MIVPGVSIIIPVYNGSNFLREAITSALAQTYRNIEVLVINDGSDDGNATREIALSFGKDIRYFEQPHQGVSAALNKGITEMRGEYFSWLSHDDLYRPEKIESQIALLSELEDATTLVYSGYELIDESGKVFYIVDPGEKWTKEQLTNSLFPVFKGLLNGCTLLIHRSHFERVGVFDKQLAVSQDIDLWFRILRNAKICYQQERFVLTRVHQEQESIKETGTKEVNEGWITRMHQVSMKEMKETMGSPYLFYKGIAEALECFSKYELAYKEAKRLAAVYKPSRDEAPLVSVIIPFYNRIPLVKEAVESAMMQSYQNLEIILVNDGSNEDLAPLTTLMKKDKRLILINSSHQGSAGARNKGIEVAKGEYIAFLDSDDLWLRVKVEKQLQFMRENQFVVSHTSYENVDMARNLIRPFVSGEQSGNIFPEVMYYCVMATPTVMVKKSALGKLRFREKMQVAEDICLWIDLAYRYEVGGMREVLSLIRLSQTTTRLNEEKVKKGYFNVLTHIFSHPEYIKENQAIAVLLKHFMQLFLGEIHG